jgi:hypothetical protein
VRLLVASLLPALRWARGDDLEIRHDPEVGPLRLIEGVATNRLMVLANLVAWSFDCEALH